MVKYIRIENEDDIVELNGERYCWNCEYFLSPYGCSNIFGFVTPFHWCEYWSKANEEDIEENKDKIDVCCRVNRIKSLKDDIGLLKEYKKHLDNGIDKLIELVDIEDENEDEKELRPEFIKEMQEIEENDGITPHEG